VVSVVGGGKHEENTRLCVRTARVRSRVDGVPGGSLVRVGRGGEINIKIDRVEVDNR
jgi:hypothetical protein